MATTPLQGWTIPGGGDAPANASAFATLGSAAEKQSIMKFTDATARDAAITPAANRKAGMVAFLTTTGEFTRVSVDAGAWLPFVPAEWLRVGAAVTGITNPASSIANIGGLIIKTGQVTAFTSVAFGNEYMPLVTYGTAFPTAALSVVCSQLYVSADTIPFPEATRAGAMALDTMNATQHRLVYVYASGTPASIKRSYLWTATGY